MVKKVINGILFTQNVPDEDCMVSATRLYKLKTYELDKQEDSSILLKDRHFRFNFKNKPLLVKNNVQIQSISDEEILDYEKEAWMKYTSDHCNSDKEKVWNFLFQEILNRGMIITLLNYINRI